MALQPGDEIGRYETRRVIGQTKAATGLQAYDPELRRDVYLVIAAQPDSPEGPVNRALLGAGRISASLSHPAYNRVFDFGYLDGRAYLVTELVELTLNGQIQQTGKWESSRAATVVREIAEAIDELHRAGLAHTHLTRGVLFDNSGRPRVASLEWAARIGGGVISPYLDGTTSFGTAPELLQQPPDVRAVCDIWSLGLILLSLFAGVDTRTAAQDKDGLLDDLRGAVPERLRQLCLQCLSSNPEQRPQSCRELIAVLDDALGNAVATRIFVSHASKDRDIVENSIIRMLETCGYRTWYAKSDIQSAAEWERSILQGLRSSDWFVVVISAAAMASSWIKDELFWAIEERPEKIIPITIDGTAPRDLHIRLGRLQSISIQDHDAFKKLLAVLRSND